jgi:hypothetical protein
MSILLRLVSPRTLAASCVLLTLWLAPCAANAAQLDTVTATGSSSLNTYSNINITAQSGTAGQNASGTVSVTVFGLLDISGPVTCLSVTGADHGGGTAGSPTVAVINAQDVNFGVVTVELVDNGGRGTDVMSAVAGARNATDCSPVDNPNFPDTLTSGRATVFDAPSSTGSDGWFTRGEGSFLGASLKFNVRSNASFDRVRGQLTESGAFSFHAIATCLDVVGNQATGGYIIDRGLNEGQGFLAAAQDNGTSRDGKPVDQVLWYEFVPGAPRTCPPPTPAPPGSFAGGLLTSGGITVGRLPGREIASGPALSPNRRTNALNGRARRVWLCRAGGSAKRRGCGHF